ncbi:heparinase II/III-family protein, partial [bacterium]|nr:heparinase II/III-family protein [bacterium]
RRDIQDYLFAKKVGSKPLLALAAQDIQQAVKSGDPDRMHDVDVCEGTNLYYNVQMALTEQEVLSWHPDQVVEPDSVWYASVGLLVSRAGAYVLGTKAGGNDDNHNHNDTGSVTLYKDGAPLLIDIGVESYTKKTFSPQRYEIWTMQSSWHNLPEFDPEGKAYKQLPGADCRATQVRIRDDLCGMEMELARAWGPVGTVPGLESYRRTVRLTEQGLALRDVTDYPGTVALTLMSVEAPVWENGTLRFGKLARAEVQGAQRVTTQSVEITDERLRWSWPDTLYRTRIWFQGELTLRLQ